MCQQRMLEIEKMLGASQQRDQQFGEAMHQMAMQTLQQVLQGLMQVIGMIVSAVLSG
jgi:hypothetical protein